MALPDLATYSQTAHGHFYKISDGAGPYKWDGTTMTVVVSSAPRINAPKSAVEDAGYSRLTSLLYMKIADNTGPYYWNGTIMQEVA